ncbi:MAG TPA: hypothetical protein PLZ16_12570, partial [Gammaproteobacteria bacterium]|nr:hypothetical protein [Gammaproteobacteria bacterium]
MLSLLPRREKGQNLCDTPGEGVGGNCNNLRRSAGVGFLTNTARSRRGWNPCFPGRCHPPQSLLKAAAR